MSPDKDKEARVGEMKDNKVITTRINDPEVMLKVDMSLQPWNKMGTSQMSSNSSSITTTCVYVSHTVSQSLSGGV